ncbi:MAG: Ig-like domain-containing protein, partial [Leptolyngbyaceae cyanobacterium]
MEEELNSMEEELNPVAPEDMATDDVSAAVVATQDTATTDENVPVVIDVLANDTDPDANELTVTAVGTATNGTVIINEDGTLTYTPTAGFSGEDSFTYTVSDGLEEVTASVAVTVNNVNEAPIATEDTATTDEDLPVVINVLANDTDADADALIVTAVGTATNGTATINEDGTLTYTPTAGFSGEDSFTYTVSDGLEEVTASVAVTVNNVNEAPIATEDTATTDEDLPVVINVLANDTDADADELTVTAVGTATSGEAVINDDGTVTYTPTAGFSGEDSFTYTVSDGLEEVTASVAVTVNNVNEAPVAVEDTATTDEDVPIVINVLANDTDADADELSVTAVGTATNGEVIINEDGTVTYTPTAGFSGEDSFTYTVSDGLEEVTASVAVTVNNVNEAPVEVEVKAYTVEEVPVVINVLANDTEADADELRVTAVGAATNGTAVINDDGTVTYTPTAGFSGEDSFSYTISDGLEEVTASVAVTVNNVNEAPVAVEDTATTDEDISVVINVLANDTDADADALTVTAVGTATNGTAVINEDGTVTYTPTAGFSGEDAFTYTVNDGLEETTASVTVTVNNVNEVPVATDDTATTDEDLPIVINVLANDTDADADELSVTAVGAATNGTAVINDDGTVTYTPTAGFSGEDSFTYTVSDGLEETTASVAVTVNNVNEAPVAVEDTATTDEEVPIVINVLANDTDADADELSVTAVGTATNGEVIINEDGTVTYTPTAGFSGEDSFTYNVREGIEEVTASVAETVNNVKEA